MKIPTHKDIPDPPLNGTKTCAFDKTFNFIIWKNLAKGQCNFFNALFKQLEEEGSHRYTKVFQVLHSDVPALLPNQEIKFLSETEHPLHEEMTTLIQVLIKHVLKEVLMIFLLCQRNID